MQFPGSSDWLPTDLANCQIHLRADLGVTKDASDNVSLWENQGLKTDDANQVTASRQPLWQSSVINGNPALHFDGLDYWMYIGNGTDTYLDTTKTHSLFIVCRRQQPFVGSDSVFALRHGQTAYAVGWRQGGDSWAVTTRSDDTWYSYRTVAGIPWSADDPRGKYCSFHYDAVDPAALSSYTVKDEDVEFNRQDVGDFTTHRNSIGTNFYGSGTDNYSGEISEIIFYQPGLSAADIATVEAYINSRYNF